MTEDISKLPPDPANEPGGEAVVRTGQTIGPVVLPTMREGENPIQFERRAERDLLDILDGMGIKEAPVIKKRLQALDQKQGQPVSLDEARRLYEERRLKVREDIPEVLDENSDLERLSITAGAVADVALLITVSRMPVPDELNSNLARSAIEGKMHDMVDKTMLDTHSAFETILQAV